MMERLGFAVFLFTILSSSKAEIGCPVARDPSRVLCSPKTGDGYRCKSHFDCKANEKCCPSSCGTLCIAMDVCLQRKVSGPLKTSYRRYYYDPEVKQCKVFNYSGRGGNENNFKTKRECNQACKKSECVLPKQIGLCRDKTPSQRRFFYNPITMKCERFNYSGCQGNSNNFDTRRRCNRFCKNIKLNPCGPPPKCPIPPRVSNFGKCPQSCVFEYKVVNGIKCKVKCVLGPAPGAGPADECNITCPVLGPRVHEESKVCQKGEPLPNATCEGNGCPRGYFCERYPNICCEIPCKFGKPHPTAMCSMSVQGPGCPKGYITLAHPSDRYYACCPPGETPGRCPPSTKPATGSCADICAGGHCINECSSDNVCPQHQKCCSNGCRLTCQKAIENTK